MGGYALTNAAASKLTCSLGSCSSTRSSPPTPAEQASAPDPRPPRPSGVITGRTGSHGGVCRPPALQTLGAGGVGTTAATACSRGRRGASCWPAPEVEASITWGALGGISDVSPRCGCPSPCFGRRAQPRDVMDFGASPPGPNWPLNFPRAGTWCWNTVAIPMEAQPLPRRTSSASARPWRWSPRAAAGPGCCACAGHRGAMPVPGSFPRQGGAGNAEAAWPGSFGKSLSCALRRRPFSVRCKGTAMGAALRLHGPAVIVPWALRARVHDRAFWVQRARLSAEALLRIGTLRAASPFDRRRSPLEPPGAPGGVQSPAFKRMVMTTVSEGEARQRRLKGPFLCEAEQVLAFWQRKDRGKPAQTRDGAPYIFYDGRPFRRACPTMGTWWRPPLRTHPATSP